MKAGLRIDVDTFRGTRYGVPNLGSLLARHAIKATLFFSVGPDNMGRHLRRLIRPAFFLKMLRTRAANLYGWDILLRGTFWPGPLIGEKLGNIIRAAFDAGHEVGLHAWDHYEWQTHLDEMNSDDIRSSLHKGVEMLTRILGQPPVCSAAPAWKCNDLVLMEKSKFSFRYNSDCRGQSIFRLLVDGRELSPPQIPVTLPTYDEIVGRSTVTRGTYNDYLLSLFNPAQLNVLTIHAEVEGIACLGMFDRFLTMAEARGITFVPLGSFLADEPPIDCAGIVAREMPGRDGWVAFQKLPPNVEEKR